MPVIRVEKNKNFTVMSNYHLQDKELSLKAKGLLSCILSLPEKWDYSVAGLSAICKEGIDCIRTTILELEKHGYITRERIRQENGQLGGIEYVVREQPPVQEPTQEIPEQEKPILENPTQAFPMQENTMELNTNRINNVSNKARKKENTQYTDDEDVPFPGIQTATVTRPINKGPTLEEVIKFAESRGRVDLAEGFFEYYELSEWHDKSGAPVMYWKQKFVAWEGRNPKPPEQPKSDRDRPWHIETREDGKQVVVYDD